MQKKQRPFLKIIGTAALLAGGAYLAYRAKRIDWNGLRERGYSLDTLHASVKNSFDEITRNSSIERKMKAIRKNLNSSNWIDEYGAALALFAEFEGFLEYLLDKNNKKVNKNLIKKLGTLKGEQIITEEDYQKLCPLFDIRNSLAHGSYREISKEQISQAYFIIETFIQTYGKRGKPALTVSKRNIKVEAK